MDHHFRLIFQRNLLAAFFLLAFAQSAAAFDPVDCPLGTEIFYDTPAWGKRVAASSDAACEDFAQQMSAAHGVTFTVKDLVPESDLQSQRSWSCTIGEFTEGTWSNEHSWSIFETCTSCPEGMQWDNDTQRCMSDILECPITGQQRAIFMSEAIAPPTFCDGTCTWHLNGSGGIGVGLNDGPIHRDHYYEAREACDSPSNAPAGYPGREFTESNEPPDDRNCGFALGIKVCDKPSSDQGGSLCGEVNGQTICPDKMPEDGCVGVGDAVACSADTGSPPAPDNGTPGETADPDAQIVGSDSDDNPGAPINIYGSGTVSGSAGGTQVSEGSGATPGDSYSGGDGNGDGDCTGDDCGDGGSYSGGESCEAPPICEGDAETCGVVRQTWLARCNVEQPSEADMLAETGLDGFTDIGVLPNDEINILDVFDDSGFLSSRECPVDMTVDYQLGSVDIPISKVCSLFELIGMLIMISAYLIAARIVAGAF